MAAEHRAALEKAHQEAAEQWAAQEAALRAGFLNDQACEVKRTEEAATDRERAIEQRLRQEYMAIVEKARADAAVREQAARDAVVQHEQTLLKEQHQRQQLAKQVRELHAQLSQRQAGRPGQVDDEVKLKRELDEAQKKLHDAYKKLDDTQRKLRHTEEATGALKSAAERLSVHLTQEQEARRNLTHQVAALHAQAAELTQQLLESGEEKKRLQAQLDAASHQIVARRVVRNGTAKQEEEDAEESDLDALKAILEKRIGLSDKLARLQESRGVPVTVKKLHDNSRVMVSVKAGQLADDVRLDYYVRSQRSYEPASWRRKPKVMDHESEMRLWDEQAAIVNALQTEIAKLEPLKEKRRR